MSLDYFHNPKQASQLRTLFSACDIWPEKTNAQESAKTRQNHIKEKDMCSNSFSTLKEFMNKTGVTATSKESRGLYSFCVKLIENDLSTEDLQQIFGTEKIEDGKPQRKKRNVASNTGTARKASQTKKSKPTTARKRRGG